MVGTDLRHLQVTQAAYTTFEQNASTTTLPPELCEQFSHISDTLPRLWDALPNTQKKELLRSLIEKVILTRVAPDKIDVKIVWVSGHYSVVHAQPPILRNSDVTGYPQMVDSIHTLWQQDVSDTDIAQQLTRAGFHSARSAHVSASTVQKIRTSPGWYRATSQSVTAPDGFLKIAELAAQLDVKPMWIYRQIRSKKINPRHVMQHPHRKVILVLDCPEVIDKLQELM